MHRQLTDKDNCMREIVTEIIRADNCHAKCVEGKAAPIETLLCTLAEMNPGQRKTCFVTSLAVLRKVTWTTSVSNPALVGSGKEIVTGVVERADMDGFSFDAQYHTYNQQHSGMSLNKAPLDSDADNVFTQRNVAKESKRRTAQPKTFAQEFGSHER
ncbi:hypothetical protein ATCC90586_002638 [Pythium insidiosum]|nr:hypothetical protein ATCC90586_002638 [Pythium insidiosum]